MKNLISGLIAALATFSALTAADDTDIYLNRNATSAPPLMMLHLDYKSDMSSTFCSDCETDLAAFPHIIAALKEIKGIDSDSGGAADTETVVTTIVRFFDSTGNQNRFTDADWDVIRAEVAAIIEAAKDAVDLDQADIKADERDAIDWDSMVDVAVDNLISNKKTKITITITSISDGDVTDSYIANGSIPSNFETESTTYGSTVAEGSGGEDLSSATMLEVGLAVLQVVFADFSGVYVGLMMPNHNDGGTILRGYELFEDDDANGAKADLIDIIKNIPFDSNGAYHPVQAKETHYEWLQYLNGGEVVTGGDDNTDANFCGNNDEGCAENRGSDPSIFSGTTYISPFEDEDTDFSCSKLYEVYATSGNEGRGPDQQLDGALVSDYTGAVADVESFETLLSWASSNDLVGNDLVADDQFLKTWILNMGNADSTARAWAAASGTSDQFMDLAGGSANLADIEATLKAAFIEALSTSTTFVAASVPVNVFNKVEALDNFFVALFEAQAEPNWPGNLKKLKLADTTGDGSFDEVQDINGDQAFFLQDSDNDTEADGRIKYGAVTYWTDVGELPPADTALSEVPGADGRVIRRGGAGQIIPGFIDQIIEDDNAGGGRQIITDDGVASHSTEALQNLDIATAVNFSTSLNADTELEAQKLVGWIRGQDTNDEDGDDNFSESRAWIMGDSIHSRPLALNYGATPITGDTTTYTETNPNIRLFMGTNYGALHIIENTGASTVSTYTDFDGITTTTEDYDESGKELYAFYPRELLGITKTLFTNDDDDDHPYGVDGEPVALVVDNDKDGTIDDGETALVYFGLRRGGKSYYALDASDPWAQPTLKWHITKTTSGSFDELGYTFSTPKVTKVKYAETETTVLIFAGGYDTKKDNTGGDNDDGDTSGDVEGRAIYIVDAYDGTLIWKAEYGVSTGSVSETQYTHSGMTHSIPSAVSALDSNSNGFTDRLYVGDTGGSIWRVDLPEGVDGAVDGDGVPIKSCDTDANGTADANTRQCWSISQLAYVGGTDPTALDRRFFHAPDIVQTKDYTGSYDAVVITSGDRANPLETEDENLIMMIKDRSITSGVPPLETIAESDLADVTECEVREDVDAEISGDSGCGAAAAWGDGWLLKLVSWSEDDTGDFVIDKDEDGNYTQQGEKGLSSPIVAAGYIYVTTYIPAGDTTETCGPDEGGGALYIMNLGDGTEARENSRHIDLGPGIPADVIALDGKTLLLPSLGTDTDGDGIPDIVAPTGGTSIWSLYLRQIGIDNF